MSNEKLTLIIIIYLLGDIFLLDRGFRNARDFLVDEGYEVKMPEFIEKKKLGQLTTNQANSSRLVTACRFPVETRNGHMKTIWPLFDRILKTYDLPYAMRDYRIGASLINKFHVTMESNKFDAETIAKSMLEKENRQNEFAVVVDSSRFNKSVKQFEQSLDDEDELCFVFPKLAISELRLISLGNYQPSLVLQYIYEQFKVMGKFIFYIFPRESVLDIFKSLIEKYHIKLPAVVLAVFKSRYRQAIKHRAYLFIDQSILGREGIKFYYCDCQHGRRLIGCCSHVLAFIGYLGYYRFHTDQIKGRSQFIDNIFV